jgi:hypothetical protein
MQVATMTDLVSAHLRDMGASLTSWLSLLDSNMILLAQDSQPSRTLQHLLLVTPNPGFTNGSHNAADSNKDTNCTMSGPYMGTLMMLKGQSPLPTVDLVCNGH